MDSTKFAEPKPATGVQDGAAAPRLAHTYLFPAVAKTPVLHKGSTDVQPTIINVRAAIETAHGGRLPLEFVAHSPSKDNNGGNGHAGRSPTMDVLVSAPGDDSPASATNLAKQDASGNVSHATLVTPVRPGFFVSTGPVQVITGTPLPAVDHDLTQVEE